MDPLKNSMQNLESQMKNLNMTVDQQFEKLHKSLDENDVRVQKLEEIVFSGNMTGEISKEIQMLKDEIEALKGKHVDPKAHMCTAVLGGLSALENLEYAKNGSQTKCGIHTVHVQLKCIARENSKGSCLLNSVQKVNVIRPSR